MRWHVAQWFEKMWWKRYLSKKQPEEYLDWKRSYWKRFLNDLNVIPRDRILDAGCGPAGINIVLHDVEVWAIDPLLDEYKALPVFTETNNANVNFLKSTLETLNLETQFDQVFCINVINHVESIESSLYRLYEHTKPHGELIITTDCHRNELFQRVLSMIPIDILHPYQMNASEYIELLKKTGWRVIRTTKLKHDFIFDYYAFQCIKD
jgi:2-polyprenyl-6-hydroxyphenyl methylase/3-demethylubiquinone-9 3-methyltransferase